MFNIQKQSRFLFSYEFRLKPSIHYQRPQTKKKHYIHIHTKSWNWICLCIVYALMRCWFCSLIRLLVRSFGVHSFVRACSFMALSVSWEYARIHHLDTNTTKWCWLWLTTKRLHNNNKLTDTHPHNHKHPPTDRPTDSWSIIVLLFVLFVDLCMRYDDSMKENQTINKRNWNWKLAANTKNCTRIYEWIGILKRYTLLPWQCWIGSCPLANC